MSLLSATQGLPERVWSLLRLLHAHGGSLQREEVFVWLDPYGDAKSAAEQTIQAASSLGLLETRSGNVFLNVNKATMSIDEFADNTHQRLAAVPLDDADAVMLEALAWIIASIERHESTLWLNGRTAKELTDDIDAGLPTLSQEAGERRFNATKFAPWKRWIVFMGLGFDSKIAGFYPAVAGRLRRELAAFEAGMQIEVSNFLAMLAMRMPYVDGGALFESAAARLRLTRSPLRLSRVLSTALRELHDDGILELETLGDAANAVALSTDTHRVKSVLTVRIIEAAA